MVMDKSKNKNDLGSQIQIKFITKQEKYAVPDFPFAVDSKIQCVNLNNLVNELLKDKLSDENGTLKKVDFDFLVNDELLRTPLDIHLTQKNVSSESTVVVEYMEATPSPEPKDCLIHDDWVSAIHSMGSWIITGCYDNSIHVWNNRGKHKIGIAGHTGPVKAVKWVSMSDESAVFVSGSQDQSIRVWDWDIKNGTTNCLQIGRGHERAVECISVSPDSTRFATGGWDAMLKIWSSDPNFEPVDLPAKRQKSNIKVMPPIMTLKGHKENISSVHFINNSDVLTASWDHTIKHWDGEIGGIKTEIVGNKSFFDHDYSQLTGSVITCSSDRHIRLYDLRCKEGSLVKNTYSSHKQWVTTVKWSTIDQYQFVSGGYDNQMKMWDTRSPKVPLFELVGHEEKVLCSDWSNNEFILSGGADNTVRIFKNKKIVSS
ncbi:ribosome biogenesis protein WDR12 homolog [Daktulosphaira vitifoliae]|uniref:ribosome biogenesis protein WDR12 homolog n=1 Tax=Daktulosphaira vitifoliae TaxID=58002 RepID=UPI0021AA6D60|nr:ribosome biogenesis protein WDR12 homolog [Daktulosphaira vitifoliae]